MSDGASAVPLAQISVKDQGKIYLKKKKKISSNVVIYPLGSNPI